MADEIRDNLQRDLESEEFKFGETQKYWSLVSRDKNIIYVEIFPVTGSPYVMRLECDGYGSNAIGGKFVDPKTKECISSAWPMGDPPFGNWMKWDPGNLFICWPGDRYGIAHHPDWASKKQWDQPPNQLVFYLDFIRWLIRKKTNGYKGRNS